MSAESGKSCGASPWWGLSGIEAVAAGLGEATPLHVTCHLASDGTKLETAAARHPPAVVSAHSADPHQVLMTFLNFSFFLFYDGNNLFPYYSVILNNCVLTIVHVYFTCLEWSI